MRDLTTIRTVASSVGKPLNVVMSAADPALTLAQLAEAGVKRISVGGALSRLALAAFIKGAREMKDQGADSMRTIGSLTLCRSLLTAGLADRFRVVVFPVITGSTGQERIYDGYPDVALEMINTRTFDGRTQLLEYVPRILAGPPGSDPDNA